jgi:SNF2 family DNA or RNA helicase
VPSVTLALHAYQCEARDYLQARSRAALWLDMGLGKTAVTLSALTPAHLPALVVGTKRIAQEVWPVETPLWRPDLSLQLVAGSPAVRRRALEVPTDLTVIGRDVLADAVPYAGRFRTLVLDESSGFKSRGSARWKAAAKIAQEVDYVWELTGTPSPNGLLDLWAQVFLLDGGERLGKTLGGFRGRYFRPGRVLPSGVVTQWIIREGSADTIHRKVADICLSMSAEGRLDLPPVNYNRVRVPLAPEVAAMYDQLEEDFVLEHDLLGEVHSASTAAALSTKLSQITAGFIYNDDGAGGYEILHSAKVDAVREIVEGTGSPVLVFYRFKAELAMLREALGKAAHTIDEPDIVARWNRGEVPVLLAHPASAGHGLNLQRGGHTLVWTSGTWSLEEYLQGNGRLARQGQTSPVVIHHLVSPGTVDLALHARLREKKSVQQALLDYVAAKV